MKLPILASLHAGIPELFEQAEDADVILVPEKDLDAYVRGIEQISLKGPSNANRRIVLKRFDIDKRNPVIEDLYRRAISKVSSS